MAPIVRRIRDLPAEERPHFRQWLELHKMERPEVPGAAAKDQDGYYPWDYKNWKATKPFTGTYSGEMNGRRF
jgi:hypothetical protein